MQKFPIDCVTLNPHNRMDIEFTDEHFNGKCCVFYLCDCRIYTNDASE